MAIGFVLEDAEELRPQITVFGVGGAGSNAVGNMISSGLTGVTFCVANTDSQALSSSPAENRIQIGRAITQGLGAGARPEIGRAAAEESLPEIVEHLRGSHMCFIAAGMGGGTGTGAAPVIARAAKELDILTVGVVTKPFQFEGAHRMRLATQGIDELQQYVDTLIVIPNQNLFRIANERTTFAHAFQLADQVLHSGVRGVTDLMLLPGLINLDFADVRSVMSEMGKAMMGTGEAEGDHRAIAAAEAAISNPLLDDVSLKGARAVLINITGGEDLTLFDVDEATNRIRNDVDPEANIIFGAVFNENMTGRVRVSVVATGIDTSKTDRLFAEGNRSAAAPAAASRPAEEPKRPGVSQPMWPSAPTAPVSASASTASSATPDRRKTTTFPSPNAARDHNVDPLDDLVRMVDTAGGTPRHSQGTMARSNTAPSVFRQAPVRNEEPLRPAVTAPMAPEARPIATGVKGLFGFMRSSREEVRETPATSHSTSYAPQTPAAPSISDDSTAQDPLLEVAVAGKVTRSSGETGNEDRLEIPAFLRRQIN